MTIPTDDLAQALRRAERKLGAYVGVCQGDTELTNTILPMCRAALKAHESRAQPASDPDCYEYRPGDSIKKIAEEMVAVWSAARQGDAEITLEIVDEWAHRIMCFAAHTQAPRQASCSHPSWGPAANGKARCSLCGVVGEERRYLATDDRAQAQPASVAFYSNEFREELRESLIKLFYRERMNEDDAILADKTIELFDETVLAAAPQPAKGSDGVK